MYRGFILSWGSTIRSLIGRCRCIRLCKYWSSIGDDMRAVYVIEGSIKGFCVNGRQLREGWRHLSVIISITLSPRHYTSRFIFACTLQAEPSITLFARTIYMFDDASAISLHSQLAYDTTTSSGSCCKIKTSTD